MSIREVWDVEACTDLSHLAAAKNPVKYERALKSLLKQLDESKQERERLLGLLKWLDKRYGLELDKTHFKQLGIGSNT